jgi:hypothetical protein
VAEEYCWAITQAAWGGRTAADPVSVCWRLDFSWAGFSVYIADNMRVLSSVLRRFAWRCTVRKFVECVYHYNFSLFHPFDSNVYRIRPSFIILSFV